MTTGFRIAVAALWSCSLAAGLFAQENQPAEAWIQLEKARTLTADRENPEAGEALALLRRAIEQVGLFPEAEIAIGEIYFGEGALGLAEERFTKALENWQLLRVPEDRIAVKYRLAEIYEIQNRYAEMEKTLLGIVADQPAYSQQESERLRNALLNAYLTRGLDQTLRLYRIENSSFALKAHAKLGWFYYRTGRFQPASILHSLIALDIVIAESVQELRRVKPAFEFTTLKDFLDEALQRENIRQYLAESELFSIAYHLAAASRPAGYPARASEIWSLLGASRVDPAIISSFGELSRRQLRSPWVDPYINPSARSIEYPPSLN